MTCYNPEYYKDAYPPTRWKSTKVVFGTARVPASMGDSKQHPPELGMYTNKIVKYEADDTVWLFDSKGKFTYMGSSNDSIKYPVGSVYSSTSANLPTFAGTWASIGSQTIGSKTVYYFERTA